MHACIQTGERIEEGTAAGIEESAKTEGVRAGSHAGIEAGMRDFVPSRLSYGIVFQVACHMAPVWTWSIVAVVCERVFVYLHTCVCYSQRAAFFRRS